MRRRFMSTGSLVTPMYIEALEDGVCFSMSTVSEGAIEYSIDECNSWVALNSEELSESVSSGTKMYIKGGLSPGYGSVGIGMFTINGKCNMGGSPASLMFNDDFMGSLQYTGYNMYRGMFKGCSSIISASALLLPATTLADACYRDMFYGCTSLTTAPELPATTLVDYCYQDMFQGCTNLNYIKMLATDISATKCLQNWVNGVASSGTFVKNSAMTSLPTGTSGIPEGWTVQNA